MPIYEYHCEKCKFSFEKLVFKGDEETSACPSCGAAPVKKMPSAAGLFTGRGVDSCGTGMSKGFS